MGRRAGSLNRGYFYRKGRGWYATAGRRMIPLCDSDGNHIREKSCPVATLKAAHRSIFADSGTTVNSSAIGLSATPKIVNYTVLDVCSAYLHKLENEGSTSTYNLRADTIFDFCTGFPARFRPRLRAESPKPRPARERIHRGYGDLCVSELLPLHVEQWIAAHGKWQGSKRTRIQALKRAFNYGVKCGLIPDPPGSPLRRLKTPAANTRLTYITPEQEAAIAAESSPAFQMALRVCIRTGVRPGAEFARLTAKHVTDEGSRMRWEFAAKEHKTGRQTGRSRVVWINDQDIIATTRSQIAANPSGPIFRNSAGTPWRYDILNLNFRRAKKKLAKKGVTLDDHAVMYSCRHTYAKRMLQGCWTGKVISVENLARLMGTSPEVCRSHYLQWTPSYEQVLWDCA